MGLNQIFYYKQKNPRNFLLPNHGSCLKPKDNAQQFH